jgi:ubiquinone/menaquinone biosynthesis C-methylase UbiE
MNPQIVPALCDPYSLEPLELVPGDESARPHLRSPSGRSFPIRRGIPVFLTQGEVLGSNLRYQRQYDHLAPIYDLASAMYVVYSRTSPRARRMEYLRELTVAGGARVLEVSVGTGANLALLPRDAQHFGIDISWRMLCRCQRKARRGLDVALFQCLAERLPFRSDTFDIVFHVGGINFFVGIAQALAEMVRVARPGAFIMVVDATEKLARSYEQRPLAASLYWNRPAPCTPPIEQLPGGVHDVRLKEVAGGDLYCLTFRKDDPAGPQDRATTLSPPPSTQPIVPEGSIRPKDVRS